MKNLILSGLLVSSLMFGCGNEDGINTPSEDVVPDSLKISGYKLVWNDEFNIDGKPDSLKWGYDIGGHGFGNDELQYYTDDSVNVRVNDGKMVIQAHYYPGHNVEYTSARAVTKGKGDWKYGRIAVRAKLPAGRGTWPAIWMLPTDWVYGGWPASGEIDIMEHVGYDQNVVHGSIHTESYYHKIGTQKSDKLTIPTASYEFHTYAIDWNEEKIDFFIDGEKYFTFENENTSYREWPFDKRFHLILNLAIGGSWGGVKGVDNTIFPVQMEVEYVRVYEKE